MRLALSSGIHRGIDADLGERSGEHDGCVEMRERGGRRRVGQVVGGHVDRLHRRDGPLGGGGDPLLELAHLGAQRRLVAHRARHPAEERGHLRPRLREPEDVVDEQQHVLALHVAEVLRDREAAQAHAEPRAGRLVHLPVHQRHRAQDARFLELEVEVVPLAGPLAHAAEDRFAAVALLHVVDELLDDHRLADAGTAEESDLAALHERRDQVDHLDAGLEDLGLGLEIHELRRLAVDGPALGVRRHRAPPSTGSPSTLRIRPSGTAPTGTEIGPPVSSAAMPRTSPSVLLIATARTWFWPMCCCTSATTRSPAFVSSITMAFKSSGSCSGSNSTSSTGPMIWVILPVVRRASWRCPRFSVRSCGYSRHGCLGSGCAISG